MKGKVIATASLVALAGATVVEIIAPPIPRLIYNTSESAPVGWYIINPNGDIERGALVAAFAPDKARALAEERGYLPSHIPLIKTVWAAEGEEICAENGVIKTDNQRPIAVKKFDNQGRPIPTWEGCISLGEGEVFLISTLTGNSFDSRYFGSVEIENVLGTACFLGKFELP